MNFPEITSVFQELITNPFTLVNGRAFLDKHMVTKPNFLLDTCKLFILSKETINFRKNVGILLNLMIQDNWDKKDIKFNFQRQKKVKIKKDLYFLIYFRKSEKPYCMVFSLMQES